MTGISGRILAATALISLLTACSNSNNNSRYEIHGELAIDRSSKPQTFVYSADISPIRYEHQQKRSRHDSIIPPEKPYRLSEPSNAQVLLEDAAQHDMEMQLSEQELCPRLYVIKEIKHGKEQIEIHGECLY